MLPPAICGTLGSAAPTISHNLALLTPIGFALRFALRCSLIPHSMPAGMPLLDALALIAMIKRLLQIALC